MKNNIKKIIFIILVLHFSFAANSASLFSFLAKTNASGSSQNSVLEALYHPPVLLARANTNDGYNLPPMSYINNTSPVLNDRGDVAFRVMSIESTTTQGIWGKLKSDVAGKIYVTAPDERFVTDPYLNNSGVMVFSLFDEGITDGIFSFNLETLDEEQVIDPSEYSILNYTYPQILDNGDIYFRGTNEKNDRTVYKYSNDILTTVFSEGMSLVVKPGTKSAVSYIFRPDVIQNGSMIMKQRFGKRYDWGEDLIDSLVYLDNNGKATLRVLDKDADEYSNFKGLSNTVSMNNKSEIAFIGFFADGKKGIYKNNDSETIRLAYEGDADISEIEYFTPKINDRSEVFFRAKNSEGKRGIYLAYADQVFRLIGENDSVETDLGPAKILWNKFYPGFSGEIDVNNKGDIVFHALLISAENDREIGAGIFYLERKIEDNNPIKKEE